MTRRLSVAIALAASLSIAAAGSAVADSPAVQLTFEKSVVVEGQWAGTVGGDETGTIETFLTGVEPTGSVWHVTFTWQVGLTGGERIAADVAGIINLKTGRVVMNGDVLAGYLAGSKIHVDAQLDLSDFSSQGTMFITP